MVRVKHRIGKYRVIAPIGAGGFSTVYRALDEQSGQEVAIKVLAENHSMVPDTRRRFVEEFNLRATVESPFIAKMFDVGTTESGQPFMVLELADRGDLRRRVEEIRRSHQILSREDLMTLARHLTEALTALHDADIVHRDVSPGNILIRSRPSSGARRGSLEQGNVSLLEPGERFLLADLGHAKDLVRSSGFTAGGGTQGFAAPEQRDDVTVVDHRADIFSATAIIEWAAHDGLFAERLEPFFDVGLAAEPEDRYPNMAEWYDAISGAVGPASKSAEQQKRRFRRTRTPTADSGRGPVPAPAPSIDELDAQPVDQPRWASVAAVVFGLLLVTALALTGFYLLNDGTPTTSASGVTTPPTEGADAAEQSTTTVLESTRSNEPLVVQPPDESDRPQEPGQLPWTAIDTPDDDAVIDGELVISGVANHSTGISHVEMTVRNLDTDLFWTPEKGTTDSNTPFRIEVVPDTQDDPNSGRFEARILDDDLDPGDYLIQVWARGADAEFPAEPASRRITLS